MAATYKITTLPGDGIGPDVIRQALNVLEAVGRTSGFEVVCAEHLIGGAALDATGEPFPEVSRRACETADAVLLGAVGGQAWDHLVGDLRPESGLLQLRRLLCAFANLRPVVVPAALSASSPLRPGVVEGTDLLIVRELTGGIYFGEPKERALTDAGRRALNTMVYHEGEIRRIARVAFEWARKRRGQVTLVDKSNVLIVSQLWREVVQEVHQEAYADVDLDTMYVDNAAMQLVLNPSRFDVVLTGNLFGDILSDLAATLPGSLGMLPSASIGGDVGVFEPVHGSAPDIAGQDKANPIAAILSVAMMLDALRESVAAGAIRNAVHQVLSDGWRTADLYGEGQKLVSTSAMGERIAAVAAMQLESITV